MSVRTPAELAAWIPFAQHAKGCATCTAAAEESAALGDRGDLGVLHPCPVGLALVTAAARKTGMPLPGETLEN